MTNDCKKQYGCEVRTAKGLACFCNMTSTNQEADPTVFRNYFSACKASPVGRARHISGGLNTGSPSRFVAVQK